ncbi:copper resistance CopC family protein [Kineosporia sp. R_H_3]|uniref:copper resistance CopC/CopD family protein n=1 Tax=Kineosporia sp. R_H_3 TaxID=1961848 RepID=UPI000B4B5EBE|nr:copper resistance CopC family protein [Kineosporia sp. R_H_3]
MATPRATVGLRRALAAAAVAVGLVVLTGPAATAHADVDRSDPPNGRRLEVAPTQVSVTLTEPVEQDRTRVRVVDDAGRDVPVGPVRVTAVDVARIDGPVTVTVPLGETLRTGSYHVSWRTVSSSDMHSTYGTFTFGVGTTVAASAEVSSAAGGLRLPAETLLRWGVFTGLAGLLGASYVGLVAARRTGGTAAVDRLLRLGSRSAAGAVAAAALLEAVLVAGAPSAAWTSDFGRVWGVVLALLLVAALTARRAARSATGRTRSLGLALAAAAAACTASGFVGHAAAVRGAGWVTAVTAAHLLSTALWSGTVLALVVLGAARRPVLGAVAAVAGPAAAVSLASGLLLAGVLVPSLGAATGSDYGRVLVLKLLLVAGAVALGAANSGALGVLRRRPGRVRGAGGPPGTRLVTAEAAVLLGVLALAGVLGSSGPPTAVRWAPTPTAVADGAPVTQSIDDLLVGVSATPNVPGQNFVTVDVRNTRRPAPGPVTAVVVAVGGTAAAPARAQGDGTWLLPTDALARSGPVDVAVRVVRGGLPDASGRWTWTVAAAPGTEQGGRSTRPLVVLGLVVVLGTAAAAGRGSLRRRRALGVLGRHHLPTTTTTKGPPRERARRSRLLVRPDLPVGLDDLALGAGGREAAADPGEVARHEPVRAQRGA